MPNITVSFPNAIVDGQNFGKVADAIANNPKLASDIQRALEAERAVLMQTQAAELKAAADKATAAEDALSSFRQTAGEFLQQFGSVNHPEVAALVQAGTAELAKPDNQRKAEQLDAQIAALAAEKAKLMR